MLRANKITAGRRGLGTGKILVSENLFFGICIKIVIFALISAFMRRIGVYCLTNYANYG